MKAGFKQTEIGWLPEEWKTALLDEITVRIGSGITPKGGAAIYVTSGHPFVRSQNVGCGKLILDDVAFINRETHISFKGTELQLNDVLLNITGASIGRSALVDERIVGGNVNQHVCIVRGVAEMVNSKYLNQCFISEGVQKQIDNYQSGGNREGLNFKQVSKISIPLPPLPEQRAIAAALSDADAWIQNLEALLEKKRLLKQGAMQQLLTPKEGWEVKRLGDCLKFGNGKSYSSLAAGEVPVYGTGGLMGYVNGYLYDGDSVCIGRKGTIDSPLFLSNKFWTVDTLFYTYDFEGVLPKYMYYQFLQIPWKDYNEASGVPSLNKRTLEQIEVSIPSLTEQTHIATILSDMDAELESLEQQLAKARQVKQGMMQELLTGRVRLV